MKQVLLEKEAGNKNGVVTHSSGNHGQAVAYAASKCDFYFHGNMNFFVF